MPDTNLDLATCGFAAGRQIKKRGGEKRYHGLHEHSQKLGSLARG